jgi:hypothetical protein
MLRPSFIGLFFPVMLLTSMMFDRFSLHLEKKGRTTSQVVNFTISVERELPLNFFW